MPIRRQWNTSFLGSHVIILKLPVLVMISHAPPTSKSNQVNLIDFGLSKKSIPQKLEFLDSNRVMPNHLSRFSHDRAKL